MDLVGGLNSGTYGYSISLDASGNAYVAGTTSDAFDGQTLHGTTDFFLTKYNSAGVRQWTVLDGTSGASGGGLGVAVEPSGNVFVVGYVSGAPLDGQSMHGTQDMFLTQYSSAGIRQWTIEDGVANMDTIGYRVAADSSGNAIVAVTGRGLDGQQAIGNSDAILAKYNSSGVRQWTAEYGVANQYGGMCDVAVDGLGNYYLAGALSTTGNRSGKSELFISQYSSAGALE